MQIKEQDQEERGQILHQIKGLEEHLKKKPDDYSMMFALARRYFAVEKYRACSKICHKLKKLGAEQAEVYDIGARSDLGAGYYTDAVDICEAGLKNFPDNFNLHISLASALNKLGRHDEELEISKKAKNLSIDSPASYILMGKHYTSSGQIQQALDVLHEGLQKFPDSATLLNNIGAAYFNVDDNIKASEYYLASLRINPASTDTLINLGSVMEKLKNAGVGMQFFEEALKIDPDNAMAMCSKAISMCNNGLAQEALPLYQQGLDRMRNSVVEDNVFKINYSNYIFYQHYVPDRSRQLIYDDIRAFYRELCGDIQEKPSVSFKNEPKKDRKLKIGLLSKGFNVHPVGQMIYQALKHLDKGQYELYCFTELMPDKRDYLTEELYALMTKVISVNNMPSHYVVERMREQEIDILIEMAGHSEGGKRLQLIAERAAPVQVKWVGGLFNTSGVPQMDWLISDGVETPHGAEALYTEKIYRMPDDYIVYYPPYYAPEIDRLPAQENGYITFGNLNNLAKTNSYSIEVWSKILHAVPNSKMLLKGNKMHEAFVMDHLYKAFENHGITRDRVIIEGGEAHQEFLNVYNRIDIALDPHPYTGGLTTCEALWMGVPVVTLPGETFAGRHAATHLTNAGMPEWIAKDERDYIDIAVKWAGDIDGLAKLRAGMREHVAKTPLVDGPKFAKNLEIALRHMWGQWCDEKKAADQPKKISKPKPKKSKKR